MCGLKFQNAKTLSSSNSRHTVHTTCSPSLICSGFISSHFSCLYTLKGSKHAPHRARAPHIPSLSAAQTSHRALVQSQLPAWSVSFCQSIFGFLLYSRRDFYASPNIPRAIGISALTLTSWIITCLDCSFPLRWITGPCCTTWTRVYTHPPMSLPAL